jgi:hypothetical protein
MPGSEQPMKPEGFFIKESGLEEIRQTFKEIIN